MVDITIHRDRYGNISEVIALHEGDSDFDRRTRNIELDRNYVIHGNSSEATANAW